MQLLQSFARSHYVFLQMVDYVFGQTWPRNYSMAAVAYRCYLVRNVFVDIFSSTQLQSRV